MKTLSVNIYLNLALRQVRRHRRKSLATGSFIMVGTTILVVLVGITVGINDAMVTNSVRLHTGQIFVELPGAKVADVDALGERLDGDGRTRTLLRRMRFSALLKSATGAAPATLYSVYPEREARTTAIAGRITAGRYPTQGKAEILLGSDLAKAVQAGPGRGLDLRSAAGQHLGRLEVCGIFTTGIAHFDRNVAYLPTASIGAAPVDAVAEYSLFYADGTNLDAEQHRLNGLVPADARVSTWQDLMPDLVQLIEMNAVSMGIILALVYGLVGFGISNTFVLTIVERYREFGILKAMGLRPGELEVLVFMESFLVCLVAMLLGLTTGWLVTELLGTTGIDLTRWTSHNRYFLVTGVVHPRTTLPGLVWPAGIALAVSLLAAYLPTRICRRRSTADLLRTD